MTTFIMFALLVVTAAVSFFAGVKIGAKVAVDDLVDRVTSRR